MNEDEPFLARWSRLKRSGDSPGKPGAADPKPPSEQSDPQGVSSAPPVAGEPLDLSTLPRLEDIGASTDIRAFLDPRVPSSLQNDALRRAWRADPVIDSFVEAAENQYDWNTPGGAPGYGPIPAGWDLAQLLAQATGKLNGVPSEEEATRPQAIQAAQDNSSLLVEQEPATGSDGIAEDLPAAVAIVEDGSAPPDPDLVPGATPPSTRRRHGGALPR